MGLLRLTCVQKTVHGLVRGGKCIGRSLYFFSIVLFGSNPFSAILCNTRYIHHHNHINQVRHRSTWYQCSRTCLPCVTLPMTDGCVHVLKISSWKFHQLAAGQLLLRQGVRYRIGRRYGPSITYKIHLPRRLTLLQQLARRAAMLGLPSHNFFLRLIFVKFARIFKLNGGLRWSQIRRQQKSVDLFRLPSLFISKVKQCLR
jgi:hypothetical protein